MTDFEQQVLSDLATLKTHMTSLIGNGQPGRLQGLERRVDQHDKVLQNTRNLAVLLSLLFTLIHIALHLHI